MKARWLLALLVVALLGVRTFASWVTTHEVTDDTRDRIAEAARDGAETLRQDAQRLRQEAYDIRACLEREPITDATLESHLRAALAEHSELYGAGYTATPKEGRLYAPYYRRPFGEVERTDVDYDPTRVRKDPQRDPDTTWFLQPAAAEEGVWLEPFFGRKSQTPLVAFGLGMGEGPERAVISLNLSLRSMHELLTHMDLGELGYAYLLSAEGRMIAHPRPDLVEVRTDSSGHLLWQLPPEWAPSTGAFDDPMTRSLSWRACETVEGPGWQLCVVGEQTPHLEAKPLLRDRIQLLAMFCAVLVGLPLLLLPGRPPWQASLLLTTASALLITGVWALVASRPCYDYRTLEHEKAHKEQILRAGGDPTEGPAPLLIVTSRDSVEQHVREYAKRVRTEVASETALVPTGVYLQSLEFVDANDVKVTGYVWQHGEHATGLLLPEAVEGGLSDEPAYEEGDVRGWNMDAVLRQSMEYRRFPFDQKEVWIRLWHEDFSGNRILVPDFDSYREIVPAGRPGVVEEFVVSGWELEQAYFAYRYHNYQTNFGISTYSGQSSAPDLYYAVQLRRSLLDAFVAHIIPLFVVMGLLFLILWRGVQERLGSTELVGASSGLFFVVLLAHIQLRDELSSPDIVYLECAYLLSYGFILWVAVTTVVETIRLQHLDDDADVTEHLSAGYRVSQLAYWPAFGCVLAVATLWFLY